MSMLCLTTELSSQDMASWAQAVGSILAILASALIAIWQGKKQHDSALQLFLTQKKHERVELAKTLAMLARNTSKMMASLTGTLSSREAIYAVSEVAIPFGSGELARLDDAIESIPLHELPDALVTPTMIFSATVRQFRAKIEQVIRISRSMNSEEFDDFFKCLGEMNRSFNLTCDDVKKILSNLESGA